MVDPYTVASCDSVGATSDAARGGICGGSDVGTIVFILTEVGGFSYSWGLEGESSATFKKCRSLQQPLSSTTVVRFS